MARQPLGRGLSALLGDSSAASSNDEKKTPTEIDIDLIAPNPEQPRTRFAEGALDELAKSIMANGIVQPIVVRPKGGRYEIVAGERRWRASQRAGLLKVPVVIKDVPDDKLLELALIENIQRQELNPIEEAVAYRKLIETIGLTQEQVAERVGRERSLVATSLRLLKLPSDVQSLIEEGEISSGHGRALLMISDPEEQRKIARKIADNRLSVRETERLVKRVLSPPQVADSKEVSPKKDPNVTAAESKLMRRLGTNVKIVAKANKKPGRLEIEYYSSDDLDRIYQMIMGNDREE